MAEDQYATAEELARYFDVPVKLVWGLRDKGILSEERLGAASYPMYKKQEAMPAITAHLFIEKLKPKKLDLEQLVGLAKVAEKPLIAQKGGSLRYPAPSLEVFYWVEGFDKYRIKDSVKNLVFSHSITMDNSSENPVEQLKANLDHFKKKHGIDYNIV